MNRSIFLSLSQYRIFWRLRGLVNSILFSIRSRIFKIKYRTRKGKDNTSIFLELLSTTWIGIFFALIFAIILYILDSYFYELHKKFDLEVIYADDYVTFLATISGISGVFIGLYYAAISMVGSSIYTKVPNNIKDLLAQDIVGNFYLRLLSFLTFLGLVLIAMRVGGIAPIYSAVPTMTLLSGVGIISFVKLSPRAFYLFDPTELSSQLFTQLWRHSETVKAGKFRWADKNFQHHAYKQASLSLDTLYTLSDITSRETHLQSKPFLNLSQNIIKFLIDYEHIKKEIPSDSMWYEQKYKHPDWYKTTDSLILIAHQSGTALQPKTINNKEWVEGRVIPILKNYLFINLKAERYTDIIDFARYISIYLSVLTKNGKVDRALEILEDLRENVLDVIASESKEELVTSEVLEKLAIIERFSIMPTSIALAYREYVEKFDVEDISKKLSNINWNKNVDLYKHEFPSYLLPRLESLKSKLRFEISTEGHCISPIWYQSELLLQVEAEIFVENTNSLISKSTNLYKSWIERTTETKHPWLASAVMSSEWEFWHKIGPQLEIWKAKWNSMSGNLKIKGLPWAKFEGDTLKMASQQRQTELVKLISMQIMKVTTFKKPESFPDYAGQFLHIVGEQSFDALLENDDILLKDIFRSYFYGCTLQFESLKPTSTDWHYQHGLKIALAPLLDLIDISGYAKLMADYHGNDQLWKIVVDVWNEYFENNTPKLSFFATAISFSTASLDISHRSVLRSSWKMKINKWLSDIQHHKVKARGDVSPGSAIKHDSALVRTFTRERHGTMHDGIDIFINFYFRTKEGSEELDFGWKGQSLNAFLDEEKKSRESSEAPK